MNYEDDIPEEAYEAIYGIDVEEITEEEYPMPKIVTDWVTEGTKFSYYNEFTIINLQKANPNLIIPISLILLPKIF